MKLRREANGLTALYEKQAITAERHRRAALASHRSSSSSATGDKIFYVGGDAFPDAGPTGLRQLPQNSIDWRSGRTRTFEFRPPGFNRTYLAVRSRCAWRPAASRSVR